MIFSRTASKRDIVELNMQNNIIEFLQDNQEPIYTATLSKFWEYSLLLKLIQLHKLHKKSILNVYDVTEDITLSLISSHKKFGLTQIAVDDLMKRQIKHNKYDILCLFGVLESVNDVYKTIDKVSKHVNLNGYLLITTTDQSMLPREITYEDLMNFSVYLELAGYDLCSDEFNLMMYSDESKIHSLVMSRIGN